MITLIIILILTIVILFLLLGAYLYIKKKVKMFTTKYFGTTNLKDAIEKSELLDSETPKSLSSMESISLNQIKKDFPNMNINELKSVAEKSILECLDAIENKSTNNINIKSDKVISWIKSRINDLKNTEIKYDKVKFHRTVINKYEKVGGIATIYFQSALEYFYKENNNIGKKVQDRFKLEFIYIIDESKVEQSKKVLGLNCPNCGATITSLGEKVCKYCGTGIKEIVKKTWTLNNINNE